MGGGKERLQRGREEDDVTGAKPALDRMGDSCSGIASPGISESYRCYHA